MGFADLFKNKKLEGTKNLCLDKYKSGDIKGLDAAIKMVYNQNSKNFIAILKYISQKCSVTNGKELGRAKELRRLWKKIDPSSYKKEGLVLKKKCGDFLSKNVIKQAEMCLSLFKQGKIEVLFKNLRGIYELEPNICQYILKYIAQNTRCDDNSRVEVTKQYMSFWSELDPSHYNKYQAKLKQAYIAEVSKLSKSSVQKFISTCQLAITKPQYEAAESHVQSSATSIASQLGSMHNYEYYNYTYLNKNDLLTVFLSSFMSSYIIPMCKILISLLETSREGNKGPAKKCYNSLMSNLKTNFNITFKQDGGLDDINSQSEQICLKSSLEDIVGKLNGTLSLLSKFKV